MAYEKELAFAKDMARQAGEIMRRYYRIDQQVEIKKDLSPITIADTEINDLLIKHVQEVFSGDGVIGEEASWQPERERVWVCDPIDGTHAYIIRVPTSIFSLALVIDGAPVVAVAYNPWTDEIYTAVAGEGAYRNGSPIHVSSKSWGEGTNVTGTRGRSFEKIKEALKDVPGVHVNTILGGVFKGCLVAEGAVEVWFFEHSGAHDVAAMKLIVEEAGGKVTDLDGNEQRYDKPVNGAIMSNGKAHQELIDIVKKDQ